MTPVYRADSLASRRTVELEGLTLLYHRPSGATHVLLPPAPEILAALADGPADAAMLADRLSREYGVAEEDEPIADIIAARLAEMEAAGLVALA